MRQPAGVRVQRLVSELAPAGSATVVTSTASYCVVWSFGARDGRLVLPQPLASILEDPKVSKIVCGSGAQDALRLLQQLSGATVRGAVDLAPLFAQRFPKRARGGPPPLSDICRQQLGFPVAEPQLGRAASEPQRLLSLATPAWATLLAWKELTRA
eukprot:tig00001388_g8582.t1